MKQITRRISFVIVFCYIIAASLPMQCYGASDNSIANNRTLQEQKNSSAGMSNAEQKVDKNTDKSTNESNDKSNKESNEESTKLINIKSTESATKADDETAGKAADRTDTEPSIQTNNAKENKPKSSSTTSAAIEAKDEDAEKNEEDLWYRKQNPMKKEHQKLLWEYCRKRGLSYIDMLALIYTESNFNEKCTTGKYHGYFQISTGNCANLAKTLKTKNKPLDGAININWGTAIYSGILADKRVKNLEGKKKRDVALSIYQRGTGGYDKYGINKNFLKVYYKKWDKVNEWFIAK